MRDSEYTDTENAADVKNKNSILCAENTDSSFIFHCQIAQQRVSLFTHLFTDPSI